jgi:outer membrane protein OmpA-like peptidoglycan-associated protein
MTFKLSLIVSSILVLSLNALEVPQMTEEETVVQLTKYLHAKDKKEDIKKAVDTATQEIDKEITPKKEIDAIYNEDRPYIEKRDINSTQYQNILPVAVEEAPPKKDDDNDDVLNKNDKCPNTPEGVKVDAEGCCLDDDHDGICNYIDKCLETPEGRVVDAKGCQLDEDKDGVLDYDDKCLHTPEMFKVDSTGCPLTAILKVNFDTNKYNIKDSYVEDISSFAQFLKENPGYDAVVSGHTDSIGSSKSNQILSQNRADSVREAIIEQGIDGNRLTAIGEGETKPIASNMNKEGRAQNRRIEVELKPKVNPMPEPPKASENSVDNFNSDNSSEEISVDNFNLE